MLKKLFNKNSNTNRYFRREITLILLIKIVLITLIWIFFVKEYSVRFDDQQVAEHVLSSASKPPHPNQTME